MWRRFLAYAMAVGVALAAPRLEKVTVCQALADLAKYNGKPVLLQGEIDASDEGGWLTATSCPKQFITGDHVWPNSISLQNPEGPASQHMNVDFVFDDSSQRRAVAKSKELERKYPGKKILWTYEGILETRDWEAYLAKYPNGTRKYIGFGHLGEAPAQIIVKAIRDVSVAP